MGSMQTANGVIGVSGEGKAWMEMLFNEVSSHRTQLLVPFSYPLLHSCVSLNSCKAQKPTLKTEHLFEHHPARVLCLLSREQRETPSAQSGQTTEALSK